MFLLTSTQTEMTIPNLPRFGLNHLQQVQRLDALGFVWDVRKCAWNGNFQRLRAYAEEHGHVLVPTLYRAPDGFKLGGWVKMQRVAKSKGRLSREQIVKLDEYGFVWDAIQFAWDSAFKIT